MHVLLISVPFYTRYIIPVMSSTYFPLFIMCHDCNLDEQRYFSIVVSDTSCQSSLSFCFLQHGILCERAPEERDKSALSTVLEQAGALNVHQS